MGKGSQPIRILIADDHPIFRDGLRKLLESEQDFRVVGEAADGAEALKLAQQLQPDILLLDWAMPRVAGLEALRRLAHSTTPVRTILLTAAIERDQVLTAMQLGARGVVMKESATELLLKSIQAVMAGEYWVGRDSIGDLVQAVRTLEAGFHVAEERVRYGLTPRERDIVFAIVEGCTNKNIAERFSISQETVKRHLSNIFDKVGVSNRLELALFAIAHNLVPKS